jgi:uncharacterized protein (TIGR02001 family)
VFHVLVLPLLLAGVSTASAGEFGGTLRFTTDYAYRGYTRSDGNPSVQANLDYVADSALFAGIWVSTVDFSTMDVEHEDFEERRAGANAAPEDFDPRAQARLEIVPYFGHSLRIGEEWQLDNVVSGYIYDGLILGASYDYVELLSQLHFHDLVSARVAVAPDAYGYSQTNVNFDLRFNYPLSDVVELTGNVGFDTVTAQPGYHQMYWTAGVKWYFAAHMVVDLRYFDSHAFRSDDSPWAPPIPPANAPIVVSLSVGF